MLKRMKINAESTSTNGGSSSSAKPISRPVTVRDEEEDDAAQNFAPGGDADYYVEEDDEGGRFFGGGLTDEQKTILNIFDRAGGEAVQDEEVCELHRSGSCGVVAGTGYLTILHTQAPELNTVGVRKLLSKLEKAVAKNQDQRSKYPNAPEKCVKWPRFWLVFDAA